MTLAFGLRVGKRKVIKLHMPSYFLLGAVSMGLLAWVSMTFDVICTNVRTERSLDEKHEFVTKAVFQGSDTKAVSGVWMLTRLGTARTARCDGSYKSN